MVTNVLIEHRDTNELIISAAFSVHRFKNGHPDNYVGRYRYRISVVGTELRIREKRCMLDMDALRPHGRVSIIL